MAWPSRSASGGGGGDQNQIDHPDALAAGGGWFAIHFLDVARLVQRGHDREPQVTANTVAAAPRSAAQLGVALLERALIAGLLELYSVPDMPLSPLSLWPLVAAIA